MFERFAEDARAAVIRSQEEARSAGASHVQPGHVLVALAGEADAPTGGDAEGSAAGIAGQALRRAGVRQADARVVLASAAAVAEDVIPLDPEVLSTVGVDLDAVRRRAEDAFGPGALDAPARGPIGHIPFAPASKKALELALREAISLHSRAITGAHLLLGILRCEDPSATAVLRAAGADVGALRADVRARLAADAA